ncbi:matrixin family metalloprotease [Methanocella paludicola]|nr:matrixin family metalloprotease [Methanocella paludicola]
MVLVPPVLAMPAATADDEDKYKLKDEWKNKNMVVEQHGELTQVVYFLTEIGDPDANGAQDAYEWDGLKWYSYPVQYTINPATPVKKYALTQTAVVQAVKNSFEAWDGNIGNILFSDSPTVNSKARASMGRPDYKNVVTWGAISDNNVIAMTTIWYYTSNKQIVDTDMVFNTYYKWGIDKDGEDRKYSLPGATFDIQNIGTHEAGHAYGLSDIYDSKYSAMTMYGYASHGEVYKRSLEAGDIAGVRTIY